MSWRLCVRGEICAAHYLRCYKGKCENMHGHNFAVEVCVEGSRLDEKSGMLVDFGLLKQILRAIIEPPERSLDHALLNDIPPFDVISPSSENIAAYIGARFAEELAARPEAANARVASVSISEKAAQTATWFAPSPS